MQLARGKGSKVNILNLKTINNLPRFPVIEILKTHIAWKMHRQFSSNFAAPIIMMSQNRQAAKDRLTAESDYRTNVKGEEEIRNIMEHLDHQDVVIMQIIKRMEAQHEEVMLHLSRLDPEMARRLGMDIQEVSKELVEEETGDSNITGNS